MEKTRTPGAPISVLLVTLGEGPAPSEPSFPQWDSEEQSEADTQMPFLGTGWMAGRANPGKSRALTDRSWWLATPYVAGEGLIRLEPKPRAGASVALSNRCCSVL